MEYDRGTVLILAGLALLVATTAASAAMAPERTIDRTGGETRTLVGVQGAWGGGAETGELRALDGSKTEWRRDSADSYFEVERLGPGRVVTSFIAGGYEECGQFESPCARTGYRVIGTDGEPTVVSEYTFPVSSKVNGEAHAVEPLPDGGFAIADMTHERLIVVENGSVVWEWRASSFYDEPPNPLETDWLHINDVDYIGEDRFLVSVRNANQILVIERDEGVRGVINEDRLDENDGSCRREGELDDYDGDGDVRCGDPELIRHQHNPHWVAEGAVLVADSENDRVVELHRQNGTWETVWTVHSPGRLRLNWPRDADRLPNGNTLITDTYNKRVVEVDDEGELVWSASVGDNPYEADRLPGGEQVGVPRHDENATVTRRGDTDLPVLSTVAAGLHSVVPGMPYWVGGLQVLVGLVSALLVGVGLVVRYRR